jgi:methionyl-tRNA synthetase
VNKNFAGKVPYLKTDCLLASSNNASEKVTPSVELQKLANSLQKLSSYIERFEFRNALQTLMEISTQGNQILQFNEPWKVAKTDLATAGNTLALGVQIVAALSVAMQPFLPFTAAKLAKILNTNELQNGDWNILLEKLLKEELLLTAGHQINTPIHLFERLTDEIIEAQIKKLEATDESKTPLATEAPPSVPLEKPVFTPIKETIQFDDFEKMDIRTGTILTAERVPKSDKLLKLTVDLGFEQRTIASGIAEYFEPQNIVGQQVVILANLAPRKMRGIESNGMILMAKNAAGKLAFVAPSETWVNGFEVK